MKYVKIYQFQVEKMAKEGKKVLMLDRERGQVFYIEVMPYKYVCEAISGEDRTCRYDFWYEEEETEEEDGEL